MKKFTAPVTFIVEDLPVDELTQAAWEKSHRLIIDTYWDGRPAPEGRRTGVRLLWSETAFYIRFDAEQNEPLVLNANPQTSAKTFELWERDVCELFIAPDARNRRRYFEFEIAPTGEWLDLIVDWIKDEPRDWEYMSGMETFASIARGEVTMVMKISWEAFGKEPTVGDIWLGNLFRQVGSGETRGYLAWSPTMTAKPQFHVPEKFGEFVFKK
jgi:alpha-galactosidase